MDGAVVDVPVTVNVVEAESPADPITVIVYTPAATLATINEPDSVPPEIEHVCEDMPPPVIKQALSLVEKPDPVTETVAPTGAEDGLSVMDRVTEAVVTVNVAEAESPVEPVAVTV